MIQIEHLYKTYTSEKHDEAHHALKDINLTIEDGSIFGIIGQSGAGKSTLVRCINLLERPTSGEIIIDGVDVTNLTGKALLDFRANVGMIFQNFSLFQQRTVLRNVTFPLELHKGYNKAEARERALELLELVGLADKANKYPSQLSGGQQQRVAIARALVNNPVMILADEATGNLDTRTSFEILTLFQRLHAEGSTIVFVTHNPEIAQFSSRNIVLRDGHITDDVRNGNIRSAQAVLDTIPVDNGM